MNNTRRKALKKCINELERISEELQRLYDEEEDYKENMPENLQCSDRYEASEEACNAMNEAIEHIDEAVSNIDNAVSA